MTKKLIPFEERGRIGSSDLILLHLEQLVNPRSKENPLNVVAGYLGARNIYSMPGKSRAPYEIVGNGVDLSDGKYFGRKILGIEVVRKYKK